MKFKLDPDGLPGIDVDKTLITASLKDMPLDVALTRIFRPLKLKHLFRDGIVVIKARIEEPPQNDDPAIDAEAMRALRTRTKFSITRRPLVELPQFLRQKTGIPFRFDQTALMRSNIRFDQLITADVDGIPLSQALKEILGPLKLAHRVVNGTILITEKRPERAPVMRV